MTQTAPCPICGEADTAAFRIPAGYGVSEWWHHQCLEAVEYNLIEITGDIATGTRYEEIANGEADWHVEKLLEVVEFDREDDDLSDKWTETVRFMARQRVEYYDFDDMREGVEETVKELDLIAAAHGADTYSAQRLADNLAYSYEHGLDHDSISEMVEYWLAEDLAHYLDNS